MRLLNESLSAENIWKYTNNEHSVECNYFAIVIRGWIVEMTTP